MVFATWLLIALFALAGALAIGAALTNASWLFGATGARMLTARLSRRTARLIYGIAGIGILAMATYMALNFPANP